MEAMPIIEALSQIGCRSLQHLHPKSNGPHPMRHLFVAKFFEPSYAKALTNHFERPDPCGVVLALGDTKGRFSVIRTGLFFLSHGLAIRRLLLSVTPENAPEGMEGGKRIAP